MQEHMSVDEYKKLIGQSSVTSKYHNKADWYDGLHFSSQKELNDYLDHKRLLASGEIAGFLWQGRLVLVEGNGNSRKAVTYLPDIITLNNDGTYVIREDKGKQTDVYKIKKKMILSKFPNINFKEV